MELHRWADIKPQRDFYTLKSEKEGMVKPIRNFAFLILIWALILSILGCSGNKAEKEIEKGDALLSEGKIDEAISHYTQAINFKPDYSIPYIKRGDAYLKLKRYEPAKKDFLKALELQPDSAKSICLRFCNKEIPVSIGEIKVKSISRDSAGCVTAITVYDSALSALKDSNFISELRIYSSTLETLWVENLSTKRVNLAHISSFPKLKVLGLFGKKLDLSNIDSLSLCKNLKMFVFYADSVGDNTKKGLEKFKKEHPKINYNEFVRLKLTQKDLKKIAKTFEDYIDSVYIALKFPDNSIFYVIENGSNELYFAWQTQKDIRVPPCCNSILIYDQGIISAFTEEAEHWSYDLNFHIGDVISIGHKKIKMFCNIKCEYTEESFSNPEIFECKKTYLITYHKVKTFGEDCSTETFCPDPSLNFDFKIKKKPQTKSKKKSNVIKLHAYAISFDWGSGYGDWQMTSVPIEIYTNKDGNASKIIVYSKETQTFKVNSRSIIGGGLNQIDGGIRYFCTDQDGKTPFVRLILKDTSPPVFHLYVDYLNIHYVYECTFAVE
ncbi:tetratricopeptide repeat protein [bacterium]|nr:tetratricopeptide repeat protein [bacterium]